MTLAVTLSAAGNGRPHDGHATARSETCFPQSGHGIKPISSPLLASNYRFTVRSPLSFFTLMRFTLDDEFSKGRGCPNAEAGGLGAVDPVPHRNDGIQVVELDLPADLAAALDLNSPDFPESCPLRKFPGRVNVLQVLTYGPQIDPEQLGDFLLVEPERFGFLEHLNPDGPLRAAVQDQFSFVRLVGIGHTVLLHSLNAADALGVEDLRGIGLGLAALAKA